MPSLSKGSISVTRLCTAGCPSVRSRPEAKRSIAWQEVQVEDCPYVMRSWSLQALNCPHPMCSHGCDVDRRPKSWLFWIWRPLASARDIPRSLRKFIPMFSRQSQVQWNSFQTTLLSNCSFTTVYAWYQSQWPGWTFGKHVECLPVSFLKCWRVARSVANSYRLVFLEMWCMQQHLKSLVDRWNFTISQTNMIYLLLLFQDSCPLVRLHEILLEPGFCMPCNATVIWTQCKSRQRRFRRVFLSMFYLLWGTVLLSVTSL
jgi:hypothetical protein